MIKNTYALKSFRNIFFGIMGQLSVILLNFFIRRIFINVLNIEYLGINGLFNNIISFLSLSELGIGSAIIYHLYEPISRKDEEEIKRIMYFFKKVYELIGVIILSFSLILLPFLNNIIKDAPNISENLKIIYLFFVFNTVITYFYSYKSTLLFVDEKDYINQIIFMVEKILEGILQIIILISTKNYYLFLVIKSILILSQNVFLNYFINKIYPFMKNKPKIKILAKTKKRIFSDTKYLMLIKLSGILVNNIDNILISLFIGIVQVGIYSNYVLIISALDLFLNKIFIGMKASIGKILSKKEMEKNKLFLMLNFLNFYFYGIAIIGILITINDIISLWLGREFILSMGIVFILAINFYLQGLQHAVSIYKEILGLFDKMAYILLFTAGINLILSITLGKKIGLFGIFLATAISRLLTNTWYEPYIICKEISVKFKKYIFNNIFYIIILIISYFIISFICNFIKVNTLKDLILKIIICFFISNLIFIIFLYKKKEFKYIIEELK